MNITHTKSSQQQKIQDPTQITKKKYKYRNEQKRNKLKSN